MKTKQDIIDDGAKAKRFLEDTDFTRFMREIEQDCWAEFKATATGDNEGREAIYMKLRGVELVQRTLRAMVDNATIEKRMK